MAVKTAALLSMLDNKDKDKDISEDHPRRCLSIYSCSYFNKFPTSLIARSLNQYQDSLFYKVFRSVLSPLLGKFSTVTRPSFFSLSESNPYS